MVFFLIVPYHFAANTYFFTIWYSFIQKVPIGDLEKGYLNFQKHPSIGVSKK